METAHHGGVEGSQLQLPSQILEATDGAQRGIVDAPRNSGGRGAPSPAGPPVPPALGLLPMPISPPNAGVPPSFAPHCPTTPAC